MILSVNKINLACLHSGTASFFEGFVNCESSTYRGLYCSYHALKKTPSEQVAAPDCKEPTIYPTEESLCVGRSINYVNEWLIRFNPTQTYTTQPEKIDLQTDSLSFVYFGSRVVKQPDNVRFTFRFEND